MIEWKVLLFKHPNESPENNKNYKKNKVNIRWWSIPRP